MYQKTYKDNIREIVKNLNTVISNKLAEKKVLDEFIFSINNNKYINKTTLDCELYIYKKIHHVDHIYNLDYKTKCKD